MHTIILILLSSLLAHQGNGLVHYMKLKSTKTGCSGEVGDLKVGQFKDYKKLCGGIMCLNKDGDALLYYCQKTLNFARCENDGIDTDPSFPQCCWQCVQAEDCELKSDAMGR